MARSVSTAALLSRKMTIFGVIAACLVVGQTQRTAAQEEKALGYRESPSYIRPIGETEAAALMAVGHWTDAKAAYERALLERPRSGFSLYGMAMSSERAGAAKAATAENADAVASRQERKAKP